MARCYSGAMPRRQPTLPPQVLPPRVLPAVWLVSDARNDAWLEAALRKLPRGSGLIYRHYHLAPAERRARFDRLAALARRRGHLVILAGMARDARAWRADGAYGSATHLARGPATLRLVTAHSLAEIGRARRARADAVVLSPVFATRSHPGARVLGGVRFRLLAGRVGVAVVALGGVDSARNRRLKWARWAAIDGLKPKDS
jgi:thiamine-phosphate pyrophosphorylase